MTVSDTLQFAARAMKSASDYPMQDARFLLSMVLDKPQSWLLAWPDKTINMQQIQRFDDLVNRRQAGEPLAYLAGLSSFWSLDLKVTPDTLIPRPDTEILVETALEILTQKKACRVLDLGTGSGAIALAIATERPDLHIVASDKSEAALTVARENRDTCDLGNVNLVQSDWFDTLPESKFDLIVSNPPYIRSCDEHLRDRSLQYEPESALVSGASGLVAITRIITGCPQWLNTNGTIILEHGYDQGAAVRDIFGRHGFNWIDTRKDYAGHERITYASRSL